MKNRRYEELKKIFIKNQAGSESELKDWYFENADDLKEKAIDEFKTEGSDFLKALEFDLTMQRKPWLLKDRKKFFENNPKWKEFWEE